MRLPWQKNAEGKDEIEFPDELKFKIEKGAEASEKLDKIERMLADQASVQAKKDADEKKAKDDAAAAAAAARRTEQEGTLEARVEELMLAGNTKEAIALATQNQSAAIMTIRADQIKREVFDDAEKFKYYHGDLKREIDSLLEKQNLQFRNDPANVENCYHTVIGKHNAEILEGKIKSRFASNSGGNTGNGGAGDTGTGEKKPPVVTDDVRRAARMLGYKPEEYAKMLDDEGVAYV